MKTPAALYADLLAYCTRNGIATSSFGALLFGNAKFAARLERGTASMRSGELAARFMADHPEVPRREFGAVAKAWRERVAAEDAAEHGAAHGQSGDCVGECTAATLEQVATGRNQDVHAGEDPC